MIQQDTFIRLGNFCFVLVSFLCFIDSNNWKFCSKETANFHRPKALWYPHDNKVAAEMQGAPCSDGPMNVILMTLGGKAIKLHVNAEELLSSVKLRASKKLG